MKKYLLLVILISGCISQQPQESQTIKMNVTLTSFQPNHFVIKTGIPVKWEIDGHGASGCTTSIIMPEYNIKEDVGGKKQTIEFTPTKPGNIEFSCWMGMVKGTMTVL